MSIGNWLEDELWKEDFPNDPGKYLYKYSPDSIEYISVRAVRLYDTTIVVLTSLGNYWVEGIDSEGDAIEGYFLGPLVLSEDLASTVSVPKGLQAKKPGEFKEGDPVMCSDDGGMWFKSVYIEKSKAVALQSSYKVRSKTTNEEHYYRYCVHYLPEEE